MLGILSRTKPKFDSTSNTVRCEPLSLAGGGTLLSKTDPHATAVAECGTSHKPWLGKIQQPFWTDHIVSLLE